MASARAIFQAHVDGLLPESQPLDLQWTLTGSVYELRGSVTLTSGDNTIQVPVGTKLIILQPPVTSTATLKLRATGPVDAFTLQPNLPNVFSWSTGTVTINANAIVAGVLLAFLG